MREHGATYRINLVLGPRSFEVLTRLQAATEASSKVETIRLALQTLAKLAEEAQEGSRVLIERRDGERIEVLLPIVPSGRPREAR